MGIRAAVLASSAVVYLASPLVALNVDGFTSATNDRFDNDPSFIGSAENFSAVGLDANGRWGTLISSNVFLSANHFRPVNGSVLRYYATNDPAGPFEERTVIAGQRIAASDIWIGILDDPLPPGYAPVALATEAIADEAAFNSSTQVNETAYMFGRSPSGFPVVEDVSVGLNILDYWLESVSVAGSTDQALVAREDISGDPNYLTYEAFVVGGDSGAPLLRDVSGTLTLVGINWFNGSADFDDRPVQEEIRNLSGFSYVGNYASEIQANADAFAVDATAGYITWMGSSFGGATDWTLIGPAIDFDGDGLDNFTEYAFVLDPTTAGSVYGIETGSTEVLGISYLEATFAVQGDGDINYFVRSSGTLVGWSPVSLTFDGSIWTSGDPVALSVIASTNNGDGTWNLTVRDETALSPGNPRFLSIEAY